MGLRLLRVKRYIPDRYSPGYGPGPALEPDYSSSLTPLVKLLQRALRLLPRFGF